MLKKIVNKTKDFVVSEGRNIVLFLTLYIILMWPLDYYIITGGGIMEIGDRIVVEDSYESKGSYNLSYVLEAKGTVATYLLSYVIPNWERIDTSDYTYDEEETKEDVEFRGKIDLNMASDNAIKNAFLAAGKTYKITSRDAYIYYVDKNSPNKFKVGDKILKVDNHEINNLEQFKDLLSSYDVNEEFEVLVDRDGKEKLLKVKLYEKDDEKILGIYISEVHKYKTYPKVTIEFEDDESGPSGGLMEALDIYDKLTKDDLTNGLVIAGTGEIDDNGNILEIGGVKYKLLGAAKKKADVFLVPNGENYKTCIKVAKENNLEIKIIGVSTLTEAIQELEKLQ